MKYKSRFIVLIYSAAEKLPWLIRHLSNDLYIFYSNLWNLSLYIWSKPSEMSNMSDVFFVNTGIKTIQHIAG